MADLLTTDACTMPTAERPLRLAEFDDLFAASLVALTVDPDGVRMHLQGDVGLRDRIRDLTARETECCSFFRFTVGGTGDDVDLSISVPPAHQDILAGLVDRAAEVAGVVGSAVAPAGPAGGTDA